MILPSKIDIQIIDAKGKPNLLANVLFGLKIFTSKNSYHNYSVFKSNAVGHITLNKQDIIDNTELKWKKNILSATPTKFELYVWEGKQTDDLINVTKDLVEFYNNTDLIIQDLKRRGITDENIPHALEVTNTQAIEDKIFYEYIKEAVNNSVKMDTEKAKGIWTDSFQKSYQFIIN